MNTSKQLQITAVLGGLAILHVPAFAAGDNATVTSFAVGAEYSTGTYGTDTDIKDTYLPLTAIFTASRTSFRLTVPYLSIRAPSGTVYDADGVPLPGSGDMTTESGLGDVLASLTVFDVIRSERHGLTVDLTGKVKLGTGDYEKGLGTGENDYTLQADLYKFAGPFTLMASAGYRFRGDPAGVDLSNTFIAAIGGSYRLSGDASAGVFFNYREASLSGNDDGRDVTVFLVRPVNSNWRFQAYLTAGFGDSSPDWGGGLQVKRAVGSRN